MIDPVLLAEFTALPPTKIGTIGRSWSEQEDILLLMFWRWRDKATLARKIGCHETTVRRHYYKLLTVDPAHAERLAEEGRELCCR